MRRPLPGVVRLRLWIAGCALLAAITGCDRRPPSAQVTATPDSTRTTGPPAVTVAPAAADSTAGGGAGSGHLPRIGRLTTGFRVELFHSPSLREAEAWRDRVLRLIDQPAYVEYENPFYRVRAGDFGGLEAAEGWRSRLSGPDFERTEVVRTLILSH